VLEREIPNADARDAMGCYPLFACADWRGLEADLEEVDDWVCLSLVTDPFGAYDQRDLQRCFGARAVPFKRHYVTELSRPIESIVSRHHRYYARKALEKVSVERCSEPLAFLDEWTELYSCLIARHDLKGIKAFSRAAFAAQLKTPGVVMLRATHDGSAVGAHLWYLQGDVAHSHLAAVNTLGYELMASYALHWFALRTFAAETGWLNLGAGAGSAEHESRGLATFKRGWATDTRTAFFCGRIFDEPKYRETLSVQRIPENDYFPEYRRGEMT